MTIRLNDSTLEIFKGATVKDVLLKYSKEEYHAVVKNQKKITDKRKNPVDLDGELSDGQQLFTTAA